MKKNGLSVPLASAVLAFLLLPTPYAAAQTDSEQSQPIVSPPASAAHAPERISPASGGIFNKMLNFFGSNQNAPSSTPSLTPSSRTDARRQDPGRQDRPDPRLDILMHDSKAPDLEAAAKGIDPKNLEIGKKIAKHFDIKEEVKNAIRRPTAMMVSMFVKENPEKIEKVQSVIDEAVNSAAVKNEEEGQKNRAIFLARNFTTNELNQLQAFFETSAGQKMIQNWDKMSRDDAIFSRELAMANVSRIREEVLKEAVKNDLKIPKELEGKK